MTKSIRKYKYCQKQRTKTSQCFLNKKGSLQKLTKSTLKGDLMNCKVISMTLSFAQRSQPWQIWRYWICLKDNNFKKSEVKPKDVLKSLTRWALETLKRKYFTKMLQSAALLQTLTSRSTKVIYLDEFLFDTRKSKFYG